MVIHEFAMYLLLACRRGLFLGIEDPKRPSPFSKIDNLGKIVIKYYLEEYFGLDGSLDIEMTGIGSESRFSQ